MSNSIGVLMIIGAGVSKSRHGFQYVRTAGFRFWTLSYQVRGRNDKTVGGQTITRCPPYIALTRPETVYQVATINPRAHYFEYWVVFEPQPDWARLLVWPEEQPGALHIRLTAPRAARALQNAFKDLFRYRVGIHPEKKALAENTLERILLLMQNLRQSSNGCVRDERVQHTMEYLSENFRKNIRLGDIAAHVHVSPFYLAHLFKKNTGMTLLHYLEMQRIEAAKSLLLSSNDAVYTIAEAVGFKNPYHFSTRFRHYVRLSPRGFRNQVLRKNDL